MSRDKQTLWAEILEPVAEMQCAKERFYVAPTSLFTRDNEGYEIGIVERLDKNVVPDMISAGLLLPEHLETGELVVTVNDDAML